MRGRAVTVVAAAAFVVGCGGEHKIVDIGSDDESVTTPTTPTGPEPDPDTTSTDSPSTTTPETTPTTTTPTTTGGTTTVVMPGPIVDPPVVCATPIDTAAVADCAAGGYAAMLGGVGYFSIQSAINNAANGDTVLVCPGMWGGNLTVDGNKTLAAADPTPGVTVIDGQANTWLVEATNAAIRGLTLVLGQRPGGGAAVFANGDVLLDCVVATDNAGAGQYSTGGAVISANGALTVRASSFARNRASYAGGAVDGGSVTVEDSIFVDNQVGYEGGALLGDGPVTLVRSTFEGNYADYEGGAADVSGTIVVEDCTFDGNEAGYGGGALLVGSWDTDPIQVTNSSFFGNTATYGPGAISLSSWGGASLTVVGGTFEANEGGDAGAIAADGWLLDGGSVTLDGTVFLDNVGLSGGGAFYVWSGVIDAVANNVVMLRNQAPGGAISMPAVGTFTCTSCDMGTGNDDNLPVDATRDGVQAPNLGLDFAL